MLTLNDDKYDCRIMVIIFLNYNVKTYEEPCKL